MRITAVQQSTIHQAVIELFGDAARVKLFGSRLDDNARGGDIDLLVELNQQVAEPAVMAARLSARLMYRLGGRKVDVVLKAPNLPILPIHEVASREGVAI